MNNDPEEATPSAADMARLANDTERAAARQLTPDTRLMYFAWGVAYLVGFIALWLADRSDPVVSRSVAGWIFGGSLAIAGVFTAWNILTKTRGVGGLDAERGKRFGISWGIGFGGWGLIVAGMGRTFDQLGVDADPAMSLLTPVLAVFVVGMIYVLGGSLGIDGLMYPTGIWLVFIAGVAAIVGTPNSSLVLGVAGGGGLIVAGLLAGRHYLQPQPLAFDR